MTAAELETMVDSFGEARSGDKTFAVFPEWAARERAALITAIRALIAERDRAAVHRGVSHD